MTMAEDEKWAVAESGDASWDDRLYLAVKTTGIYCLISCPARMPLRKNVEFFDTAAEAEAAGYRACKICRPQNSAR